MERRNFLSGATAVTLAPALPIAASAATPDRSEWSAAMAILAKIEAEDAAFTPGWWEAHKLCKAECEAIPHITLRSDPHTGRKAPVSTADTRFVMLARDNVAKIEAGTLRFDDIESLQDHVQLCRDVAAAADKRDSQVQSVRDRWNMDAQDDKAERLGDQLADAQEVLMKLPAPDMAALRWKLDQVSDKGESWDSWSDEYVAQLNADIVALLPEAA